MGWDRLTVKKFALGVLSVSAVIAIGVFAAPAVVTLATGAAFVATTGMVLAGLAHVGIVIGACCTALIANRTLKAGLALRQEIKNPVYTHTKIMKQGAGPEEGHHILVTHKTDSAKHAVYHVSPGGRSALVATPPTAERLRQQLITTRPDWSPGKRLHLEPAEHTALIPAGVFSRPQAGASATSSFAPRDKASPFL